MRTLRNVPILTAALVATAVVAAGELAHARTHALLYEHVALDLAVQGAWLGLGLVTLLGGLELVGRVHGRAALGARIAAVAFALDLGLELSLQGVQAVGGWPSIARIFDVSQWVELALSVLALGGLVVAAWHRRGAAITGLVVGAVSLTAPVLYVAGKIWSDQDDGYQMAETAINAATAIHALALLWLVHHAEPAEPVPDDPRAARGLRLAANSLWCRLLVAALLVLFMLAAIGAQAHGETVMKIALVGQVALELLLLGAFAIGALQVARGALAGVASAPFVLAGLGAAWCAGVMLVKTVRVCSALAGSNYLDTSFMYETLDALVVAEPVIAIGAIAVVAIGVRAVPAFALERGYAVSRASAFVVLMLCSLGVTSLGLPKATSEGALVGMMLLACGLGLVAMALAASLIGRVAGAIDAGLATNLPAARIES